jgi:serine/threonine protein phosphatase PrpC
VSAPAALESALLATVFAVTHPGLHRGENQDSFLVADLGVPAAEGPWRVSTDRDDPPGARRFEVGPRGLLAVVADGMGGAAAGALASRLAVAEIYGALATRWAAEPDPTPRLLARSLRDAVEAANAVLHRHATREPACAGMGTTATVAGVLDGCVVLAQVGDSRAYLVRGGVATQLTRDQSLVQKLMDAGTLTPDQAERSGIASVLLQALGPEPRVRVDVTRQPVRRGDVLVLCSDGLSRTVPPAAIAAAADAAADPAGFCAALLDTALAAGAPDNVTVVAAVLDGAVLQPPRDGDPVGHTPFDVR